MQLVEEVGEAAHLLAVPIAQPSWSLTQLRSATQRLAPPIG